MDGGSLGDVLQKVSSGHFDTRNTSFLHATCPPLSNTDADVAPKVAPANQMSIDGPHILYRRIDCSVLMLQVTAVPEAALAAIAAQLLPGLVHLHRKSHMVLSQHETLNYICCMSVCRQPCTDAQFMYTSFLLTCRAAAYTACNGHSCSPPDKSLLAIVCGLSAAAKLCPLRCGRSSIICRIDITWPAKVVCAGAQRYQACKCLARPEW